MSFTLEQIAVLEALNETFGPFPEANPEQVEPIFVGSYERSVEQYVGYAVDHWKAAELAVDPALPALKDKLREAKRLKEHAKLAARKGETRESLVSGIISGLMPKINRRLKSAKTSFFISEDTFELYTASTIDRAEIDLVYQRSDFSVMMRVNDEQFHEDWTALNGNRPMREQSEGYLAIVTFLEAEGEDDDNSVT